MDQGREQAAKTAGASIAPLKNVALCAAALEEAIGRATHLPGMVVFYGPAGWGKSYAAAYCANVHEAFYIECKSTWTKKAVLAKIAENMGLVPAPTTYGLTDQVSERLAMSGRPLIIDEMDHLVKAKSVEIIRDLYEGSGAPILLIGEDLFPHKLEQWERFHSRILNFVRAQAADAKDAETLTHFYCNKVTIAADLLGAVTKAADGSLRRLCVNLARIEKETLVQGKKQVDLAAWAGWKKGLLTGEAPTGRR